MSKTVTGVRWKYRSLITLLGLWSGLVGVGTEYYTSSTCISCAKSLKPKKLSAATGVIYGLTLGVYVNHHSRRVFVSRCIWV